jgi:hypothetical protein
MSEYLTAATITTNANKKDALEVLSDAINLLLSRYEFGFRGIGCVMQLGYNNDLLNQTYEVVPAICSATDLTLETLSRLANRYQWFSIEGSIGFEGEKSAYDILLALCPTQDKERPFCVLAHYDHRLWDDMWDEDDDDAIDHSAAERLRKLILGIAAHKSVDGFQSKILAAFSDIRPFDTETLKNSLINPCSISEARQGEGLTHGIVSGIKKKYVSQDEMIRVRGDGDVFSTTTGFTIISGLVEVPKELYEQ